MKRSALKVLGCLLALFFVGMLLVPEFGSRPADKKDKCRLEESDFNRAIIQYQKDLGNYPTGENSEIVRVLEGDNPQMTRFLVYRRTSEHPNEMADPWETPYQIQFIQQTNFVIRSAGPDKILGDKDDIIFNSLSNNFVKP